MPTAQIKKQSQNVFKLDEDFLIVTAEKAQEQSANVSVLKGDRTSIDTDNVKTAQAKNRSFTQVATQQKKDDLAKFGGHADAQSQEQLA